MAQQMGKAQGSEWLDMKGVNWSCASACDCPITLEPSDLKLYPFNFQDPTSIPENKYCLLFGCSRMLMYAKHRLYFLFRYLFLFVYFLPLSLITFSVSKIDFLFSCISLPRFVLEYFNYRYQYQAWSFCLDDFGVFYFLKLKLIVQEHYGFNQEII